MPVDYGAWNVLFVFIDSRVENGKRMPFARSTQVVEFRSKASAEYAISAVEKGLAFLPIRMERLYDPNDEDHDYGE